MFDQISVYAHTVRNVQYYHPDKFCFRDDRPAKWLQKLCLWTLKKLSCFYLDNKDVVTRIEISQRRVIEGVQKQVMEVMRSGKTPHKVYIGRDIFFETTRHLLDHNERYGFGVSMEYGINGEHKILGLDVVALPYFDGVLVV